MGTDPTTELNVIEGVDANGCAAACSSQPGCISYVLYDYFGLCGLFNVPVSEIAADTGDYTFWDISVRISHEFFILRTGSRTPNIKVDLCLPQTTLPDLITTDNHLH